MKYSKKNLVKIAEKVQHAKRLKPEEVSLITSFQKESKEPRIVGLLKQSPVPLAVILGMLYAAFPAYFANLTHDLPRWTNLPPVFLAALDYLWGFVGDTIGKANILYHLPNIILYSYGVLGLKTLFDALKSRSWVDRVLSAKAKIEQMIQNGTLNLSLKKGHSVLFMGKGDFIGMQFVLGHSVGETVILGESKPSYSDIWNYYNAESGYDDLKTVIDRSCESETGEYIFFPVKDDQIFLPAPTAYDLSPYKLDILCQDIRMIEKKNKWKKKRVIIVGDKYHKSHVHSEDKKNKIKKSDDEISMQTIATKYANITLLDPTDLVLRRILEIAKGRKVVFRATNEGIKEYKNRFFKRIEELGYKPNTKARGVLTIGYDLFEDQTEQQTLSRKIDDYYPIVLSKIVRDALIRNGYKTSEFIYVPELVLSKLSKEAAEQ